MITDEEENLNTSPTDAFIIKIDKNLSATVFEEFHEAAKTNQVKKLKKLFSQNKGWLERRDQYDRTPLHSAIHFSAFEAAEFLLKKGADPVAKDENGNTSLHYILTRVLENKLYIPYCKVMAKPLLEEGADSHIKNNEGKSPLDLAVETGEKELIDLLK